MRRSSHGGTAVAQSLASGSPRSYTPSHRSALVETALPRLSPLNVLVAQNALAVCPRDTLLDAMNGSPRAVMARLAVVRQIANFNVRRARHVVCLSQQMSELVSAAVPCAAARIITAPVTLPISTIEALSVLPQVPQLRDTYVAVPGIVSRYKAIPTIVRALARIRPTTGCDTIRICGPIADKTLVIELRDEATRLSLKVEFLTLTPDDLIPFLRDALVVALPSRLESLGFLLPESVAVGARIAATDIPAHRETALRLNASVAWFVANDASSAATALLASIRGSLPEQPPLDIAGLRAEWANAAAILDDLDRAG